jgi:hypothetical protein
MMFVAFWVFVWVRVLPNDFWAFHFAIPLIFGLGLPFILLGYYLVNYILRKWRRGKIRKRNKKINTRISIVGF